MVKLFKMILEELVLRYRWEGLAYHIDINCFKSNPSIKSSLTFLRKTPWARKESGRFVFSFIRLNLLRLK